MLKASLSVPGRYLNNTLFFSLASHLQVWRFKNRIIKTGIFGVQNIMSLEDMGACSSNEKYNCYPMNNLSCLRIRFEQNHQRWIVYRWIKSERHFNDPQWLVNSLLGGSDNGWFVLRTDVLYYLGISDVVAPEQCKQTCDTRTVCSIWGDSGAVVRSQK